MASRRNKLMTFALIILRIIWLSIQSLHGGGLALKSRVFDKSRARFYWVSGCARLDHGSIPTTVTYIRFCSIETAKDSSVGHLNFHFAGPNFLFASAIRRSY